MGRTGEQGSRTLVHASTAGQATNGKYMSECQVKPESQFVRSEAGRDVQEKFARELQSAVEHIQKGRTQQGGDG